METLIINALPITPHSERVAKLSRLIAEAVGIKDAPLLEACALWHDVGKKDVPGEILNKPGKLTPSEFALIKLHADHGEARINNTISLLEQAAIIALQHHEQWSGGGYHGLRGEEIHPWARIVAIADVLDALVSRRSYKDSWSLEDALVYIRSEAGNHFDPDYATALLSLEQEVRQLYGFDRAA